MKSSTSPARSPLGRRRAGVIAGVAVVATGVLAVPALALTRDSDAEASTAAAVASSTTTVLPAPSTTLPAEPPVAETPAEPADPAVAFAAWWDTATPEQRLAFQFATMTPEEAAAFKTFVTPPPPPAPKPKTTVTTNTGGGNVGGFLACVRNRESRGNYGAVNGSSGAAGAYQFMPQTWNNTARHAGRPDLVGMNPSSASAADQDAMAQHLLSWQGTAPWGGGC